MWQPGIKYLINYESTPRQDSNPKLPPSEAERIFLKHKMKSGYIACKVFFALDIFNHGDFISDLIKPDFIHKVPDKKKCPGRFV